MWNTIVTLFNNYVGDGLLVITYLCMLIYLYLTEERSELRVLIVYTPMAVLVMYFLPPVAKLFMQLADEETYYRLFWLLPIVVTLSYGFLKMGLNAESKKKKILVLIVAAVLVIEGRFIYANDFYKKSENAYHMPNAVVDICDTIVIPGREVMAVLAIELVQYVRQYTDLVCMPYGRENLVERWGNNNDIANIMRQDEIVAEELSELADSCSAHYIILPEDKKISGDFNPNHFALYAEVDGYKIYRSKTAYFGLVWPPPEDYVWGF